MWPVKKRKLRGTLFLVISAESLTCALSVKKGSVIDWPFDWKLNIPISRTASGLTSDEKIQEGFTALVTKLSPLLSSFLVDEVRVLVDDDWIMSVSVPWNDALRYPEKIAGCVRMYLEGKGDNIVEKDSIRLDDAPYGVSRLAVIYPAFVLQNLHSFATRLGAKLSSVLPVSVAVWTLVQEETRIPIVGVIDQGKLTLLLGSGQKNIVDVITRPISVVNVDTLKAYWRRFRLRNPAFEKEENFHILDLRDDSTLALNESFFRKIEINTAISEDLSGIVRLCYLLKRSHHRLDAILHHKLAPSILIFGMLSLAFAGLILAQTWQSYEKYERLKFDLNEKLNIIKSAKPNTLSKEEVGKISAVNVAIQELNLPITVLLAAMVPPKDIQISILSVETAARSFSKEEIPMVKIVGTAKNGADMALYVAFLSERKPFVATRLIRHEVLTAHSGEPYKFIMEAQWKR